ncbi:MAG: hypothetical protein QUT30_04835 [Acidobacteriota bacterium]|nr:hypothetical protein [Acidobacteriota bacterium]
MKRIQMPVLFMFLFLPLAIGNAQEKAEHEVDIHSNVKLLEMPIPQDMPEELKAKYQIFVQRLKDALQESTSERTEASALTIQVRPGVKEIGAAKTKRALARVTGYKKDSKAEYFANIFLHSYETGDTVNKTEIEKFLSQQIFGPLGVN